MTKTRTATQPVPWSQVMALAWKRKQQSQKMPPVQKLILIIKTTSAQPRTVAAHSNQVRARNRGETRATNRSRAGPNKLGGEQNRGPKQKSEKPSQRVRKVRGKREAEQKGNLMQSK